MKRIVAVAMAERVKALTGYSQSWPRLPRSIDDLCVDGVDSIA